MFARNNSKGPRDAKVNKNVFPFDFLLICGVSNQVKLKGACVNNSLILSSKVDFVSHSVFEPLISFESNAIEVSSYFLAVAKSANPGRDADFYAGKIASAKFFVRTVLPHIKAELKIVLGETGEIMEIPESAF